MDTITDIFEDIAHSFNGLFSQMEIAEEEIQLAQKRHGEPVPELGENFNHEETGPIWNSFRLLRPTHDGMDADIVYRTHCAELLDRVAKGEDTRLPTGAELILLVRNASLAGPLTGPAAGLYFRLLRTYFPEIAYKALDGIDRDIEDYERMYGPKIDDHEAYLRRKLVQDWRK
jgi:hypothetical protein